MSVMNVASLLAVNNEAETEIFKYFYVNNRKS
jgi:hypothetical protein